MVTCYACSTCGAEIPDGIAWSCEIDELGYDPCAKALCDGCVVVCASRGTLLVLCHEHLKEAKRVSDLCEYHR